MKRMLLLVQMLILAIFVSTGSNEIDTNRKEVPSLPAQAQDQAYYNQLTQSGNRYTKDHYWLKNGSNYIQVGISYYRVGAIGDGVNFISPVKLVDETFVKGDLLAEITGLTGNSELRAPCDGKVVGINPLIQNPTQMAPNQVWVYKCELKRAQLGTLMDDQEYAKSIQ